MAKGNDEAHNPNRRPKRPGEQTEDEKIEIVKQVFPNAEVIDNDKIEEPEIPKAEDMYGELENKYSRNRDRQYGPPNNYGYGEEKDPYE